VSIWARRRSESQILANKSGYWANETGLVSLEGGAIPMVLGGDLSLSAGSVASPAAHARRRRRKLGLIWVDADGDIKTPGTTTSGNVHGMPLAALLGPEPAELSGIAGFSPTVDPSRTVLLEARNLDPGERRRILDSGIHVFTMNDVDRKRLAAASGQAIALAGAGTFGIHVSLDLDACDPTIALGWVPPSRVVSVTVRRIC
jgi:arginase